MTLPEFRFADATTPSPSRSPRRASPLSAGHSLPWWRQGRLWSALHTSGWSLSRAFSSASARGWAEGDSAFAR